MSNIPRTVAIKYGWAEGPWHATRLVRELRARGFTITDDAAAADVIFAHSAGCYAIPPAAKAQLILLVGLPYAPIHQLIFGLLRKEVVDFKYHRRQHELRWWVNKLLHNGWYVITRPWATYRVVARHKAENLPSSRLRRVLLVHPSDDVFMRPEVRALLTDRGYDYVDMKGIHDSCWVEPQAYVNLITQGW